MTTGSKSMRFRFAVYSLVLLAAGAGCSSTSVPLGSVPGATQAIRSLATVDASGTKAPVYPLAAGDTFTYNVRFQILNTQGGTSTIQKSYDGSATATLGGPVNYNGNSAYSLRLTGTSTSTPTTTIDYTDYINEVDTGGQKRYVDFGYDDKVIIDETHGVTERDHTSVEYGTPFINDVLPEITGASWTNPVAIKETVNDYDQTPNNSPNILSGTLTRAADGSYTASGENYDVPITRQVNPNGTGFLVLGPASAPEEWSYALPQAGSSGEVIPATESFDAMTHTNDVPDWYPGGGAAASPLAQATGSDAGVVAMPKTCGTQAGGKAKHLKLAFTQLDTVAGFTDAQTDDLYVIPGEGLVCKLESIVQTNYDNENTGTVTSVDTTTLSEVLTSEVLK